MHLRRNPKNGGLTPSTSMKARPETACQRIRACVPRFTILFYLAKQYGPALDSHGESGG